MCWNRAVVSQHEFVPSFGKERLREVRVYGLHCSSVSRKICWMYQRAPGMAVLSCASSFSRGRLFVTPWTIAHQAPLSMGILQTRILEWVAMPSSTGSPQPRDRTQVSRVTGGFFQGSPRILEWVAYPVSRGSSDPGTEPGSPALQGPWLPLTNALQCFCASFVAQLVKNLPAMQETWVWSLGREDPLEKGKVTHSSILAWRIPRTSARGSKESDTADRLSLHFTPLMNARSLCMW